MNDFYNIIIISRTYKSKNFNTLTAPVKLTNQATLIYDNKEISFDYLIFDDISLIINLSSTSIICDNLIPLTNFFHQTSIENIFYTSKIDQTLESIINNEI